jgi:hypothetical protein
MEINKVERIGCNGCQSWHNEKGRCLVGKVNPPTVKAAVDSATFGGIGSVCNMDGMKGKVILKLKNAAK